VLQAGVLVVHVLQPLSVLSFAVVVMLRLCGSDFKFLEKEI